MHCVFSYDLTAENARREEIVNSIEACFSTRRFIRVLSTFYVLHIQSLQDWQLLNNNLTALARALPNLERLDYVLTPPMNGGHYDGLLSPNYWTEINQISSL